MKMHDINPERKDVILLLHPMLATAQMMNSLLAHPLGSNYRFLIPDLSGHGEAADQIYKSAAQEALEIDAYLTAHQISSIALSFGASMGGLVLMELLEKSQAELGFLFFEGTSFQQNVGMMESVIRHVMVAKHRKAQAHPEIAVTKMEQLYGSQVNKIMANQMVGIREESLIRIVHDCSHVHLPDLSEAQQKRCIFAYGEKDGDLRLARKIQPKKYPHAQLLVWPGFAHCTRITSDNLNYVQMLKSYLAEV